MEDDLAVRPDWNEVLRGGLPPVALGLVRTPLVWFTGYEQTYLEREVRDWSQVEAHQDSTDSALPARADL